ncbi:branched-chain amino acid ABC transporter permease [Ramlibacter sp. 2FC]|uniref:branched-chain amino acid ABC transporter permease n=1 Tax=Ramlibacter sp. 2FC TaxID=2502188 RepID=UPI0010F7EA5F|nr:branched-chain amino acid ABC transporter permease [Ramlibacter sp. 2FC]
MSTLELAAPVAAPVRPPAWRWIRLALAVAVLCYLPVVLTDRAVFGVRLSNMQLLNIGLSQVNLMLIAMLGSVSLTYLTGCAGLISIGHAAFYAVGAMAGAIVGTQWGLPFPVALLAAAGLGAVVGVLAGLPSLRVRGLYFLLSTLAMHHIAKFVLSEYQYKFFDVVGIPFQEAKLGSFVLDTPMRWYFFLLPVVILVFLGLRNSMRSREGRALLAMRDHELAATSAGIDVRVLRLKVFGLSSSIAAVAGCLYAYYMTNVNAEFFNLNFAIQFIAMIIIGGMGSLAGAAIGAALWLLLPAVITGFATQAGASGAAWAQFLSANKPQMVNLTFGVLVVLLLIFAPGGIAGLARQLRNKYLSGRGGQ